MPTFSKIVRHGPALTAAGLGIGAAVYLVQDFVKSGSSKECLHAIAAGTAVAGIGSIVFYVCLAIGCESLSSSDNGKANGPMAAGGNVANGTRAVGKSSLKTTNNPLVQYAYEHSHVHPVIGQLHKETMNLPMNRMASAPEACTFLTILAKSLGAKNVLDIGVYTGLSTLALALGVADDGKVVSCELEDSAKIDLGRKYWKIAGVDEKIELHFQPAADTLQELIDDGESGTFDMAFIDADKVNYLMYFKQCYKLLRSGGLMIVDNTTWLGKVTDASASDESTVAIRMLNDKVAKDDRVLSVMLLLGDGQTVIQKL